MHAAQVTSVDAVPEGTTLPEPTAHMRWSWHALVASSTALNEFGLMALLHTSHTVSALAVPAVATPCPTLQVVWVLQPSKLLVDEKVSPWMSR